MLDLSLRSEFRGKALKGTVIELRNAKGSGAIERTCRRVHQHHLSVKRAALVEDKIEAYSQGDLRENFGFKAAKDAIRAVDRKMDELDRLLAAIQPPEVEGT